MNYTEEDYGTDYKHHILEQYKLYVEMSDRVSQRRASLNVFFISVNTLLITVVTFFGSNNCLVFQLGAFVGIILSFAWYYLLSSYRHLNSGKFKVICEMEKLLPISPYEEEWNKLGYGKDKKLYCPISYSEKSIPVILGIFYIILLVYTLIVSCF